jgi:16S rRNA (uracil1498-N3)-methyltransferase
MAQLQRLVIAPTQLSAHTIALTSEQRHYLTRVLRLKGGDRFIAICEQQWWLAQLHLCQPEAQLLEPVVVQTELKQPITLLAALTKGQGFEEVVRAATEMGVAVFIPLITARTIMNPGDGKLERWRRIAAEAAEQSCRQIVPEILAPMPFETALSLAKSERFAHQQRLICVTAQDGRNLWQALANLPHLGILVMVGPEGGWTAEEQAAAIAQGFTPVSLGRRVLRAVTASFAAIAMLSTRIDAEEYKHINT